MFEIPLLLILIVVMALVFDFTNGAHDCANAIATVVSTKVCTPKTAVLMAASLNLVGALLGTEVAKTLGGGLINPALLEGSQLIVLAALVGATVWNFLSWNLGIPSSSSHALIGGLLGSAWAYAGMESIKISGLLNKVILPFIGSPLAGFAAGLLLMTVINIVCAGMRRNSANLMFRRLQLGAASLMALSHGLNDAQKTMGIITLALLLFGRIDAVEVPLWVKLACAGAMCLGTALGGWKIVKTMGSKIFKLEPVHGFAAQAATASVIAGASLMGAPVSTTQTVSASIFGVGASKRVNAVRWGVAGQLVVAWIITLPCTGAVGYATYMVLSLILQIQ